MRQLRQPDDPGPFPPRYPLPPGADPFNPAPTPSADTPTKLLLAAVTFIGITGAGYLFLDGMGWLQ